MIRVLLCLAMFLVALPAAADPRPRGLQSARVGREMSWAGIGIVGASLPVYVGGAGFMHYNYKVPIRRKAAYDRQYLAWLDTGSTAVPIAGAVLFVGMGTLFTGTLAESAGLRRYAKVRLTQAPWVVGTALTLVTLTIVPFSNFTNGAVIAQGAIGGVAVGCFLVQFGLNRRAARALPKDTWESIYGKRKGASVTISPLLDIQRKRYGAALVGVF